MRCPKCDSENTSILDSRIRNDGNTRRRRRCRKCQYRFSSIEIDIDEYDDLKELAESIQKVLVLANRQP